MSSNIESVINRLPKVEQVHLESTLEPNLLWVLAKRNRVEFPYGAGSFLELSARGVTVLQSHFDFYDLTVAYLRVAHDQKVKHVELCFNPQTHTERRVPFGVIMKGVLEGLRFGKQNLGISSRIVMCFLQDRSEESAFATLNEAEPFRDVIYAVGLDSQELGHAPAKFTRVFRAAAERGYRLAANAGEVGNSGAIWQALQLLGVQRLDQSVRVLDDLLLMNYLKKHQVPISLCPLAQVKRKIYPDLQSHVLPKMLSAGLNVSINSGYPAYLGHILDQMLVVQEAFKFNEHQWKQLATNAVLGSFASKARKQELLQAVEQVFIER